MPSVPVDAKVREILPALQELAIEVAGDAARLIREERPADLGAQVKSSRTDVVTVMDQAAQDLILEELARRRPADAVYGEEDGGRAGSSGLTWVLDPIDGTTNYLYELPAYAVSVAAVIGDPTRAGAWRPVAAAVADVTAQTIAYAGLGAGAWRLDRGGERCRLRVRADTDLALALVATGFGYAADLRARQAQLLTELLPRVRDIRRMGSAALDLCRVASGEVDAYYETGLNPWDLAGGWLIALEAGAVLGGLSGADAAPDAHLTWATGPGLAASFGELVTGLTRRHVERSAGAHRG